MKRNDVDVILSGQETIGSAEREVDKNNYGEFKALWMELIKIRCMNFWRRNYMAWITIKI